MMGRLSEGAAMNLKLTALGRTFPAVVAAVGLLFVSAYPISPCQGMTVFKEDVIGFVVKKPDNWMIRYTTGIILVLKDFNAEEGVLIYPVRAGRGLTLADFMTGFLGALKKAPAGSSRIDFSEISRGRDKLTATLAGTMGRKEISGTAAAFPSGPDFMITICWAPKEMFASRQETLGCIADSYQRTMGLPLVRLKGEYFETMAPRGWKILDESQNGINFRNPSETAGVLVGYVDFGGDPRPMTIPRLFDALTTPCAPGQQSCFSITRTYNRLAAVDAPDFTDGFGRPWKARAEEFDATLIDAQRSKVHGVLTAMIMNGQHITKLYGWIFVHATRMSRPETWERDSAATAIVQENLIIIKASELITGRILPRNNPYDSSAIMGHWAYANKSQSERSEKFQEAIMGFDAYRMPGGERIEVPLNSIPGGNNPLFYNPQTGHLLNSTLESLPLGYVPLKR
jgi:hypothetical protein